MVVMLAIASSLLFYAVIVEVLRRTQPQAVPVPGADSLRFVFFALAGIVIFTTTVTKGMLMRSIPPHAEARISRLRTTSILTAALAEIPAVFGLALFLTTRRRGDFYILLVVAAYMLVRHFPQKDAWELYVRRGSEAR
jgi:hypothetical protein